MLAGCSRDARGMLAGCPAPEPAERHRLELLCYPKLRVAGEHRVWSATRSAILVRAVPVTLLQKHGRQIDPLEATTKLFDREEGLGDEVGVAIQPHDLRAGREPRRSRKDSGIVTCPFRLTVVIIGITPTPVVLPGACNGHESIATSHDDLAGESQKSSRNLSARVMAKSASSSAAPRRATSRFSDTDCTSSHFA